MTPEKVAVQTDEISDDWTMSEDARLLLTTVIGQARDRDYPNLKLDKYFEFFSAEQVLKSKAFNLSSDELESGIVGGGGDGGVDGFYLFVNKKFIREDTDPNLFKGQQLAIELIITQARNKNTFEESVPDKFRDFTDNCLRLNADTSKHRMLYSDALLTLVDKFHTIYQPALSYRPTLLINYYYVTLGEHIDKKVSVRQGMTVSKAKECFPMASCDFEFVGAKNLLTLFYQQPTRVLPLEVIKYFDSKTFGKSAYVCLVRLPEFYEFITQSGQLREHVFEANVRDFAGDVRVNKGISETLATSGTDDFWWLNNGITVLASLVNFTGGRFQIEDPLIVNGLQTSYLIHRHFQQALASKDDERTVLVRIIENTDTKASDRIINATNSQTAIQPIWLHAAEDIHRRIETAFQGAGLYYDRRKNYYRTRGVSVSKIVTLPYLAQAVAAIVLQKPDDARARPTTVADKQYSALFSESYPIGLYIKCAQIVKQIDAFLIAKDVEKGLKLNLIFYIAMDATCRVLKSRKPNRARISRMNATDIDARAMEESYARVLADYKQLGAEDRVAKGTELLERIKSKLDHALRPQTRRTNVKHS